MKNLITVKLLVFLFFVCLNNVNAQEHFEVALGKIQDGKPVLTLDKTAAKKKWAAVINKKSKLNLSFDELTIKGSGSQYYLIARDNRSKATSVIMLIAEKGILYERADKKTSITVTCTGCTSTGYDSAGQCEPLQTEDDLWLCTNCSAGTCTKTITREETKAILDKIRN